MIARRSENHIQLRIGAMVSGIRTDATAVAEAKCGVCTKAQIDPCLNNQGVLIPRCI